MGRRIGNITIENGANVWPHEMDTARALAAAGFDVAFVRRSEERFATSEDVRIDGTEWEVKSPKAGTAHSIDRNVRKALHQSRNVIIDSRRMKGMPDAAIERELRKIAGSNGALRRVLFVNRRRNVIDIK